MLLTEWDSNSKKVMFHTMMDGYQNCMTQTKMMFLTKNRWLPKKMCDTNKNVTKKGVIIKGFTITSFQPLTTSSKNSQNRFWPLTRVLTKSKNWVKEPTPNWWFFVSSSTRSMDFWIFSKTWNHRFFWFSRYYRNEIRIFDGWDFA